MIEKKTLSAIRLNLLVACARAGVDVDVWFDKKIRKAKSANSQNIVEFETLKLVQNRLRADASRKGRIRKRVRHGNKGRIKGG